MDTPPAERMVSGSLPDGSKWLRPFYEGQRRKPPNSVCPITYLRRPFSSTGPHLCPGFRRPLCGHLHPELRCVAPSALFIMSSPISESVLNAPDPYNNKIGRIPVTEICGRKSTTVPPGMFFRKWRSAPLPQLVSCYIVGGLKLGQWDGTGDCEVSTGMTVDFSFPFLPLHCRAYISPIPKRRFTKYRIWFPFLIGWMCDVQEDSIGALV